MISLRLLAMLPALAWASVAPAQSITQRAERDEVVAVEAEDPDMLAAFDKARATLDSFLALLRSPPARAVAFAVKVKIVDGSKVEYFWVNEIAQEGDGFAGAVNNEPKWVTTVRLGERIRFSRAEIYDWTYVDRARRRMKGNFTSCALLKKDTPRERAAFKRQYRLECDR
jgi:uncharacterized protein YegJ (DUF2314 family)